MKLKVCLFCLFCFAFTFSGVSISKKSYESLTQRDRILLSVSYLEVSFQYKKMGKKDLSKQYFNLALKIEKDAEKYFSGELKIPQKKIEIDWDSIYESDPTTDENTQTDDEQVKKEEKADAEGKRENDKKNETAKEEKESVVKIKDEKKEENTASKKENNSEIEASQSDEAVVKLNAALFIESLRSGKFETASGLFSNQILIENENIVITSNELKETMKGWLEVYPDFNPGYYEVFAEKKSDKIYEAKIKFSKDIDFFISLTDNYLILKTTKVNDDLLFDTIVSYNLKEEKSDSSENIKNEDTDYDVKSAIPNFIRYVLDDHINLAMDYFEKDVWFEEYKILINRSNLEEYLKEWQKQYSHIKNVEDIVFLDSIKDYSGKALFKGEELDLSSFSKIEAKFKSDPIVPGNPNKSTFIFVIEKTDLHPLFKIVGVAQVGE